MMDADMAELMVRVLIAKHTKEDVAPEQLSMDMKTQDLFPGAMFTENYFRFTQAIHDMFVVTSDTVQRRITRDYPADQNEYELFETLEDLKLYFLAKGLGLDEGHLNENNPK